MSENASRSSAVRAIDAWVNVRMPAKPAPWQIQVAKALFKRPHSEVFKDTSFDEMLETMDRLGFERVVLTLAAESPDREVLAFADKRPDRFWFRVSVDPRTGMKGVRELQSLARQHPVVLAGVIPCVVGVNLDDRIYYPLYAKCVELQLPVAVNTGIPGPPLPGKCQDPMLVDDVCLYFPELTLIMANGADPWWSVAIRLMLKYPNLYLMTSAYAPKYLPAELIQYMNTRGQDKILFATDYPFLTLDRCLAEAQALNLREGVLDKFLYANAMRLFSRRSASSGAELRAGGCGGGTPPVDQSLSPSR